MGTCGAGIARTRQAVRPAGITRLLAASGLASAASAAVGLASSACLLVALRLACSTGEIARLACSAGVIASVAGGLVTFRPASAAGNAGIVARPAARAAATGARETCAFETRATSAAVRAARSIEFRAHARRALTAHSRSAQPDVEIKLVFHALSRAESLFDGSRRGDLGFASDEDPGAPEATEWRLFGFELFALNDILGTNLDTAAHVEAEVEEPIALSCAAPQQSGERGQSGGSLARAARKPCNDRAFLERPIRSAAVVLLVCHRNLQREPAEAYAGRKGISA
jgi:hypothetical protein